MFVDVTAQLSGKIAALRWHVSQVDLSAMVEPGAVLASARHWGAHARVGYAEAFAPTRVVLDLVLVRRGARTPLGVCGDDRGETSATTSVSRPAPASSHREVPEMSQPAELHLAAIQRQYDEAVARIDQLSELWGPKARRRHDDEEAPDPLDPDAVTMALNVARARQAARGLTPHSAVAACPRSATPDPCPEHRGEENFVAENFVAENFDGENFVVQPPADEDRFTVWGFALPNRRRRRKTSG